MVKLIKHPNKESPMPKLLTDIGQFAQSLIRKGWARVPWYHKLLFFVAGAAMIVYAIGAVGEMMIGA
ncbi:hypothetical protein C5C14_01070 [Rathayibacter rathayi]|nr:hypothetical protein C5C14_01070 [Rathayibacter rathayi]